MLVVHHCLMGLTGRLHTHSWSACAQYSQKASQRGSVCLSACQSALSATALPTVVVTVCCSLCTCTRSSCPALVSCSCVGVKNSCSNLNSRTSATCTLSHICRTTDRQQTCDDRAHLLADRQRSRCQACKWQWTVSCLRRGNASSSACSRSHRPLMAQA